MGILIFPYLVDDTGVKNFGPLSLSAIERSICPHKLKKESRIYG